MRFVIATDSFRMAFSIDFRVLGWISHGWWQFSTGVSSRTLEGCYPPTNQCPRRLGKWGKSWENRLRPNDKPIVTRHTHTFTRQVINFSAIFPHKIHLLSSHFYTQSLPGLPMVPPARHKLPAVATFGAPGISSGQKCEHMVRAKVRESKKCGHRIPQP